MRAIANARGTAGVEAVVSLLFFASFVSAIFITFYLCFGIVWINRQAYEAVVCLASTADRGYCEHRLRTQTKLPLGVVTVENVKVFRSRATAQASFDLYFKTQRLLSVKDSRALPLTGDGS